MSDGILPVGAKVVIMSEEYNQCDGCMAGMDLKEGNLHTDYAGNAVMVCQADRYRVGKGGEA